MASGHVGAFGHAVQGDVIERRPVVGVVAGCRLDVLVGDQVGAGAAGVSCSGAEMRNLPGALRVWACHPAASMPWPRMRSTSLRSRTRKQIRTSICDRTAPWPMAFCVGRWVAAMRVTATARPRRAMESVSAVASGVVSASSAYSSTMMTRAGMSGLGSQTRWPVAARWAARASRMAMASASRARASAGVVASRAMHGCPWREFHAALEVDGPDDDIGAGGEVAHEHVEQAALARSGDATEQGVPAQEQHLGGRGVLERAEVDRFGDGCDGRAGPGDRVGVRVSVEHAQLEAVGQVVGSRVDADRAAVGA